MNNNKKPQIIESLIEKKLKKKKKLRTPKEDVIRKYETVSSQKKEADDVLNYVQEKQKVTNQHVKFISKKGTRIIKTK